MFSTSSRYADIATTTYVATAPDGMRREITYVRRRMLPPLSDSTVLTEHTMAPGERLDHVATRYFGDATQFWRICDATDIRQPGALEDVGRRVPIAAPLPGAGQG